MFTNFTVNQPGTASEALLLLLLLLHCTLLQTCSRCLAACESGCGAWLFCQVFLFLVNEQFLGRETITL
ncbi:hypothetical protein Pcinc_019150 [Petrolisthes cinctipes]|uniref:Secreted protein n=1 Tax=Petrolisthes cinctipes TaxID=88211 RepID=A0AAE1KLX9_PETCI|nr:hypothetical protein Pcinc_019150 [Petrolisthes cinctipes]